LARQLPFPVTVQCFPSERAIRREFYKAIERAGSIKGSVLYKQRSNSVGSISHFGHTGERLSVRNSGNFSLLTLSHRRRHDQVSEPLVSSITTIRISCVSSLNLRAGFRICGLLISQFWAHCRFGSAVCRVNSVHLDGCDAMICDQLSSDCDTLLCCLMTSKSVSFYQLGTTGKC
jgi:hypothetical protein